MTARPPAVTSLAISSGERAVPCASSTRLDDAGQGAGRRHDEVVDHHCAACAKPGLQPITGSLTQLGEVGHLRLDVDEATHPAVGREAVARPRRKEGGLDGQPTRMAGNVLIGAGEPARQRRLGGGRIEAQPAKSISELALGRDRTETDAEARHHPRPRRRCADQGLSYLGPSPAHDAPYPLVRQAGLLGYRLEGTPASAGHPGGEHLWAWVTARRTQERRRSLRQVEPPGSALLEDPGGGGSHRVGPFAAAVVQQGLQQGAVGAGLLVGQEDAQVLDERIRRPTRQLSGHAPTLLRWP